MKNWNYECIRDFAGSLELDKYPDYNRKIMAALPEAVHRYAAQLAEQNDTNHRDEYNSIISMIDHSNTDMVDHRTGIDCKDAIIRHLTTNKKVTDQELVAILDVIYVDDISAQLESCAIDIIDGR